MYDDPSPKNEDKRIMSNPVSERFHIEDLIDSLCYLDDEYEIRVRNGSMTPVLRKLYVDRIGQIESELWDLELNTSDLEWFSNRPIYGINAVGDLYAEPRQSDLYS